MTLNIYYNPSLGNTFMGKYIIKLNKRTVKMCVQLYCEIIQQTGLVLDYAEDIKRMREKNEPVFSDIQTTRSHSCIDLKPQKRSAPCTALRFYKLVCLI